MFRLRHRRCKHRKHRDVVSARRRVLLFVDHPLLFRRQHPALAQRLGCSWGPAARQHHLRPPPGCRAAVRVSPECNRLSDSQRAPARLTRQAQTRPRSESGLGTGEAGTRLSSLLQPPREPPRRARGRPPRLRLHCGWASRLRRDTGPGRPRDPLVVGRSLSPELNINSVLES